MKIAVSAMGNDLDSPFSPVFGRCPVYVIVDTDTMSFQAVPEPQPPRPRVARGFRRPRTWPDGG